jgi:hypothetical protein
MNHLQKVIIKPLVSSVPNEVNYSLCVIGSCPDLWTNPGIYDTAEEALDSFCAPLREELRARAIGLLFEGREVAFSLEDAFEDD